MQIRYAAPSTVDTDPMPTVNRSRFILEYPVVVEHPAFNSAAALLDALDPRRGVLRGGGWVFRGHADARWRLIPSALRSGAWLRFGAVSAVFPTVEELVEQIANEFWIVQAFADAADRQGLMVPGFESILRASDGANDQLKALLRESLAEDLGFPPVEWEAAFAMAQHYGVPTRLLDWTESSQTACYFAAAEASRLLHAHPRRGRRNLKIWAIDILRVEELVPSAQWGAVKAVRAPWATNPNLRAQRGLFTVHRHRFRKGKGHGMSFLDWLEADYHADLRVFPIPRPQPLDRVVTGLCGDEPDDGLSQTYMDKPLLHSFTLPWAEAPTLLNELAHLDTSAGTLFPGYNGAAQSLLEHQFRSKAGDGG